MQDGAYGLPRIFLPGTSVNKGKRKKRDPIARLQRCARLVGDGRTNKAGAL